MTLKAAKQPDLRLQAVAFRDRVVADPAWFFTNILGSELYPAQVDIVKSVRDNFKTSVAGANGTGKDFTAGRIVIWWLLSRYPAKVVIMGPTFRQVADIVWKETRSAFLQAKFPLGGRMMETPRWTIDDSHFAIGFSTDRWENIQGFHSPNLLVIITEAHAVAKDDIDALMKLQPKRVLMTGNTLVTGGEFYDSHHSKRDQWAALVTRAEDTPNIKAGREVVPGLITKAWIDERRLDWGENSPVFRAAVLAEFPDDLEGSVVPLRYANEAAGREPQEPWLDPPSDDKVRPEVPPVILACDVARSGDDKTVVVRRQGPNATILHRAQGHDLMRTTGVLVGLYQDLKPAALLVDAVGLGAGVVDRLKELGIPAKTFNGGEAARQKDKYFNQNAEVWWAMREWFLAGAATIPKDPALIGQVSSRMYEIQSDRKVKLESKDDMRKRGVRSPDEADALAMTFVQVRRQFVYA